MGRYATEERKPEEKKVEYQKKGEEGKKTEQEKKEEAKPDKPSGEKEERKTEESKDSKGSEEVVLRVYMHCEGCAKKVKRSLRGFEVFFQTERGERRRLHSLFESSREGEREHYPREFERPEGTAAAAGNPRSLSRLESEGLKLRSREEEEDDDGKDDDDDDDEKRRQKQETLDDRNNARKMRLKN